MTLKIDYPNNNLMSLRHAVEALLSLTGDRRHVLYDAVALSQLLDRIDHIGSDMLRQDTRALYEVHEALFVLNEKDVSMPGPNCLRSQFDPTFLAIRSKLESWADRYERERIPVDIPSGLSADDTLAEIVTIWKTHSSANHPIFEYVRATASRQAIREYLRSDYLLNIRFYDLVVYSLIGIDERVRFEVAHNLWDEVGQGDPSKTHVQLYRDLLGSEGIDPSTEVLARHLSWQGLAGYNLMMRHGLHRNRYFESLGSLAVTELADPEQYRKFVEGCRRVGIGKNNPAGLAYYEEHISIDVIHGDGWLRNVIRPQLQTYPEASPIVLSGVHQRLNTAKDYWDELLDRMRRIDMSIDQAGVGVAA
ncbi:iron-containing redox enzyme family protein [Burkholderia territorii]|uniref:iron-containing redox enzyme family protein n=1 Tax=Burkholderia territorii TaxID=1503055 RepID=UPI0012D8D9CE|nr:iron-containing redox enzyme family protein [Burkholderia territorii]